MAISDVVARHELARALLAHLFDVLGDAAGRPAIQCLQHCRSLRFEFVEDKYPHRALCFSRQTNISWLPPAPATLGPRYSPSRLNESRIVRQPRRHYLP